MEHADVIIIGAGAAGLMAAKDLSSSGKKVIVLEGNDRTGGRIYTIFEGMEPVQLGAEFIHGDLPLTIALLREANIKYHIIKPDFYKYSKGKLQKEKDAFAEWTLMMQKMEALTEDMSLQHFLDTHFAGEKNADFRKSVTNYASGFDAADPCDASTTELYQEWENENGVQYRIQGGYQELVNYLANSCIAHGCRILLSEKVLNVNWKRGNAEVHTASGKTYSASKVIVTVPVRLLQNGPETANRIHFNPEIGQIHETADRIGYGSVIKVIMRFTEVFWKESKNMRFILSDEKIPTWWTHPGGLPILTGWAAGPKTRSFTGKDKEIILAMAIHSLSGVFSINNSDLQNKILAFNYCNWEEEPYACGAYSYAKAGHASAKPELNMPVEHTIYIAGEACCNGILRFNS